MQLMDDFLRSIQRRLRCPPQRRSAVIEELRGHLVDRREALAREGMSQSDAERWAVREMGAAWLLALRLSTANGWRVVAHILRELWAAGVGFEIALGGALVFIAAISSARDPGASAPVTGAKVAMGSIALAVGTVVFPFAMARVVRGWMWAVAPAATLVYMASLWRGSTEPDLSPVLFSAGLVLLAASALGQRRESPRLAWFAWVNAGLIPVCILAYGVVEMLAWGTRMTGGVPAQSVSRALALALHELMTTTETPLALVIMAVSWLFWLAPWVIEQVGRGWQALASRLLGNEQAPAG